MFTILDIPLVARSWLGSLVEGRVVIDQTPAAWREWVANGRYLALTADTPLKEAILSEVYGRFRDAPVAFEEFAARVFQMHDQRVIIERLLVAA